jgi:hypothetical protein
MHDVFREPAAGVWTRIIALIPRFGRLRHSAPSPRVEYLIPLKREQEENIGQ